MNRFAQVRNTNNVPIHPSLLQINPRQHNRLEEKPVTPAPPKKPEAPIQDRAYAEKKKKGAGLSTDKKSKVLEFLEFNL